jgi:membrane protease YdiL (CAAX protease family)
LVGLALSLFGGTVLGQVDLPRWIEISTARSMLANSLSSWLLVAALFGIVVYWEGRQLESLGLRLPTSTEVAVGLGAGLGGVVLGISATAVAVVTLNLDQPETLSAITQLSVPIQLAIVGTAVVVEEILWRGYPIERLTEVTGRLWIGAGISGLVFLGVHYPGWGLAGAIPQAVFTAVLVGVYVWSRNVVVSMLTHGVLNLVMIFVLPAFL